MTTRKPIQPILEKYVGPITFGMFMRVARTTMGVTQVQMAKKLGITKGTLCDIEKGRQLVSATFAVKVARKA
jgi:DNA-binding XRE family transcriptional regulator